MCIAGVLTKAVLILLELIRLYKAHRPVSSLVWMISSALIRFSSLRLVRKVV